MQLRLRKQNSCYLCSGISRPSQKQASNEIDSVLTSATLIQWSTVSALFPNPSLFKIVDLTHVAILSWIAMNECKFCVCTLSLFDDLIHEAHSRGVILQYAWLSYKVSCSASSCGTICRISFLGLFRRPGGGAVTSTR